MRNLDTNQLLAERAWLERVAYGLVRNEAEAKDVAQTTLLRALESSPPNGQLGRGWLAKVAANVVRMNHRSGSRRQARERSVQDSAEPETKPRVMEQIHRQQTTDLLSEAVARLSEPWRSSVKLRFLDELTIAQVAEMQGVALGTADSRIREGLRRLRIDLDAKSDGDARPWLLALCPQLPFSETNAAQAAATGGKIMTKTFLLLLLGASLAFGIWYATLSSVSADSPKEDSEASVAAIAEPTLLPPRRAERAELPPQDIEERGLFPLEITVNRPAPNSMDATPAVSFSFSDDDLDRYAGPSPLGKAMAVHRILFPIMGCYDAFQERNPEASPYLEDISISIAVEFTAEDGGIVTGVERGPRRGELEAEFDECLTQTSYGLGFHHSPVGLQSGTVTMTVDFKDRPLSEEEKRAATVQCEEELEMRSPGMSQGQGRFDDLIFVDCIKRRAQWSRERDLERDAEIDAAMDACLQNAFLRRPSLLNFDGGEDIGAALFDDDEFSRCMWKASNPDVWPHPE